MKKIDKNRRLALIRLYKKRERKHRNRKKQIQAKKRKKANRQLDFITINAPSVFDLRNQANRRELLQFINDIKETVLQKRQSIKINFSNTTSMVVCGTLRFFAELNHIKNELGSLELISCNCPKNETVAQVLQHLGILKMLSCNTTITPNKDNVIIWKKAFGNNTDATNIGEILEEQLPRNKSKKLFRGVSEAMTNVSQHAYLINNEIEIKNKGWWLFYRKEKNNIFVAFCDLGVGIPVTLPQNVEKNNEQSLFKQLLSGIFPNIKKYSDSQLIQAAIELGRTRTKQRNRGKGLPDIVKTIETMQNGNLVILSNRGEYFCNNNGYSNTKNYKDSIAGTLIIWSFDIETIY